MKLFHAAITSAIAVGALSYADPAPTIHYAPAENLERVDVALIDTARQEIDLAAYVLTDWPVIEALARAANRGVKVRIYLHRTQLAEHTSARPFLELVEAPGVETRTKRQNGTPMHLKSYQIDGRVLRTGAVIAREIGREGVSSFGGESMRMRALIFSAIEVAEVLDQWFGADYRYCKIRRDDGAAGLKRPRPCVRI